MLSLIVPASFRFQNLTKMVQHQGIRLGHPGEPGEGTLAPICATGKKASYHAVMARKAKARDRGKAGRKELNALAGARGPRLVDELLGIVQQAGSAACHPAGVVPDGQGLQVPSQQVCCNEVFLHWQAV